MLKFGVMLVDLVVIFQPQTEAIGFNFTTLVTAEVLGFPLRIGTMLCLIEVDYHASLDQGHQQHKDHEGRAHGGQICRLIITLPLPIINLYWKVKQNFHFGVRPKITDFLLKSTPNLFLGLLILILNTPSCSHLCAVLQPLLLQSQSTASPTYRK